MNMQAPNVNQATATPVVNPPVVKQPTGRTRGGQPGHRPHLRQRLPAERVTEVLDHFPPHCAGCQAPLPKQAGPTTPSRAGITWQNCPLSWPPTVPSPLKSKYHR